jgi:hypothetical protein
LNLQLLQQGREIEEQGREIRRQRHTIALMKEQRADKAFFLEGERRADQRHFHEFALQKANERAVMSINLQ